MNWDWYYDANYLQTFYSRLPLPSLLLSWSLAYSSFLILSLRHPEPREVPRISVLPFSHIHCLCYLSLYFYIHLS